MNYKMIGYLLGQIMRVLGLLMLLPLLVGLIYHESATVWGSFLGTAAALAVLGTLMTLKKPEKKDIYTRDGMATVAAAWILVSVLGAVPFTLSGNIPNFADAVFETASGFTTTGATILNDIEAMSNACLFWRSFSHFLGGMGVLILILAILPQSDTRTMYLVRAESPGPTAGKLTAKMSSSVRNLYGIYIALTVLEMLLLLFSNLDPVPEHRMSFFEALNTALSTAGTGGFALKNASIAAYDSAYIDGIVTLFMLLFSINFTMYYLLLTKNFAQVFKNEELRFFLGIVAFSAVAIAVNILPIYGNIFKSLRYSSFQVLTMISTAGFATADFTEWPFFSQMILLLLMFVGGCAGSTGGGLKVMRILLLCKTAFREIKCVLNPRAVVSVKCDGKAVDKEIVRSVSFYFVLFMLLAAISMLLLSLDGHAIDTTVTAVITCLNNVGPGLNEISPSGNFAGFSSWAKILLSLDMLLGRLEIYPLLVLFTIRKK
ncbi:MAG: TrkH family potassium uptake protein [Oscillospiraceae bacterium]|nr:TrkH family potassium uptake protein [Oscillospiraceae bacterium]